MSVQQIFFLLVLFGVSILGFKLYGRIYRNIRLARKYQGAPDRSKRWRNVLLVAFGQRKMFKNLIPAFLHLFIYIAFLFTQIELIEILIDGIFGVHRFFASYLGLFYTLIINVIEVLSLLALVGTVIFLWRRNLLHVSRFENPEMTGWPKRDANLILLGEILLITGIFTMNGADALLQNIDPQHYPDTGNLVISAGLGPLLFSGFDQSTLVFLERTGWWLHILVVFGFLLYLPVSKHLHILLAFPNTYFARQHSNGKMNNMPEIMQEVKSMLGMGDPVESATEIPEFGVSDIRDLTWKNLLDAYTCTECGRCTAVCPANLTGKKLSPRKIMMDVRDRVEEVSEKLRSADPKWIDETKKEGHPDLKIHNFNDGKSLFEYISKEELHACTTCNACVEACPVLINPLEIILEMRRYEILTQGSGPQDWLPMFTSLENSGSVWQVNTERDAWIDR
ncbi:MAG: 4Fe-4S dicluster domain-containing protein [Saprospiraceae bacterium]|nr:4Fe-4S dicluster domain-containing protein [Saprospiraceae bacterium]